MTHKGSENLIPFKPGQSGNPKGRPKGSGITDKLKALLDSEVILKGEKLTMADAIAQVIINKALKADHKFVREILDRTEGKVTDNVKIDGEMKIIQQRFTRAEKPDVDGD